MTNRCGLLFSGGLDSTSSALAHSDKNLLLITIRGVWDVPLDMDELWQERKREFEEFASAHGHENAYIVSNFSPFLKWEILNNLSSEISSWRADTAEGLGMFGLAAPLMYAKGIPFLLMASSFEWSFPWPSAGTPLVDDHLMFASGHAFKNDQFHMTRLDKLQFVAQRIRQGAPRPKIKVCEGQNSYNSLDLDCAKCIPMAFSLLVLSEDPRLYGFDASDDKIISAMKQYLLLPQKYWTLWELSFVQDYLRQQPSQDPRLSWFTTYDLGSAIDYELEKSKQMVHWDAFSDIAPKGLTIPHYSWRLLDVQKEKYNDPHN